VVSIRPDRVGLGAVSCLTPLRRGGHLAHEGKRVTARVVAPFSGRDSVIHVDTVIAVIADWLSGVPVLERHRRAVGPGVVQSVVANASCDI